MSHPVVSASWGSRLSDNDCHQIFHLKVRANYIIRLYCSSFSPSPGLRTPFFAPYPTLPLPPEPIGHPLGTKMKNREMIIMKLVVGFKQQKLISSPVIRVREWTCDCPPHTLSLNRIRTLLLLRVLPFLADPINYYITICNSDHALRSNRLWLVKSSLSSVIILV